MAIRQRITKRKAIIEKILADEYAGGPVLLEELRWKVLAKQYGPSFVEMTDAKQKSFARTIRNHLPRLIRRQVPIKNASVGMITRAALYRLKSKAMLERFLAAEQHTVAVNIGFPDHQDYQRSDYGMRYWDERRSRYRKRLPRVTVGCFFLDFAIDDESWPNTLSDPAIPKIVIPKSHRLVGIQNPSRSKDETFDGIAIVPWTIWYFSNAKEGGGAWSAEKLDALDLLPRKR